MIGASLVFGIGRVIAGICPGPAVAILFTGALANHRVRISDVGRYVFVLCLRTPDARLDRVIGTPPEWLRGLSAWPFLRNI